MKYFFVSIALFICFTTSGCSKDRNANHRADSAQLPQAVFDIPRLLKMDISHVKKELGNPVSEFIPTEIQISLVPTILATAEYKRGTTSIQIDYSLSGEIRSIFIADETESRKEDEILLLGNLKPNSNEYSIRIQNWVNPALAKQRKAAEIAGIEVITK